MTIVLIMSINTDCCFMITCCNGESKCSDFIIIFSCVSMIIQEINCITKKALKGVIMVILAWLIKYILSTFLA